MHRSFYLSNINPLSILVVIVFSIQFSTGCSSNRSMRDKEIDNKEDAGAHDSSSDDGVDGSKDSPGATDRDGGGVIERSTDSGNDTNAISNQDGASGISDAESNTGAEDGSESQEGSGGSHTESAINVPYENLQQIPNSSARVCPNSNYSQGNFAIFATCDDICPKAHCVDNFFISFVGGPEGVANVYYPCGPDSSCIPDQMIATLGGIQSKKCRSIGNMEGACVSVCQKNTASSLNANFLPQDSCFETEVCVPCYDPIKGGLTAFNPCGNYLGSSCNEGAKESGIVFDECCNGDGTCIPGLENVNPEVAALLGKGSCAGEDDLCLPSLFGIINYLPAHCETDEGEEGRCLSECLSLSLKESYTRRDCAANELCIPCSINGKSTGACNINDDEPGRSSDS